MLLSKKIVSQWTVRVLCFIVLVHQANIFCLDATEKQDSFEKVESTNEGVTSITTETNRYFNTQEGSLEVNRDQTLTTSSKILGVTKPADPDNKAPENQNQNKADDKTTQSSTSQTEMLTDTSEWHQSPTLSEYFTGLTTPKNRNDVGSQVSVVNVTGKDFFHWIDFDECSSKKRIDIIGDHGTIILDIVRPKALRVTQCNLKFTVLRGNVVSVLVRRLRGPKSIKNFHMYRPEREECVMFGTLRCTVFSPVLNQKQYYSEQRFLQYTFTHNGNETVRVILRFKSHRKRPEMVVSPSSPTSGIITSPMYDGVSVMPTGNIGHNTSLTVPPGFVVMISVQHFDLVDTDSIDFCIRIKKIEHNLQLNSSSAVKHICVADGTNIQLFDTSVTIAFFPELTTHSTKGFKLLYSFHKMEEQPVRLDSGLFNCSTQLYKAFKQHVECNLITECENGEDELDCPYTSDSCRQGIYFRNKCYFYFSLLNKVSWKQANLFCWKAYQRFATFQNSSDLEAFADVLKAKHPASFLWVGLQVSDSRLGTLYKRILRWVNSKSLFDYLTDSTMSTFPSCALMQINRTGVQMKLNWKFCNTPVTSHILCQQKQTDNSPNLPAVLFFPSLKLAMNWSREDIQIIRCSDRHFALDFLSCNSYCHNSFVSHSAACVTPSGGIMPMFQCHDSDQMLPFTLVCDHRADCLDYSDETFCYHQGCRGFECHNGKCIRQQLRCNKLDDCEDGSDENDCYGDILSGHDVLVKVPTLSLIDMDGSGSFSYTPWNDSQPCPETHFKCPQSHCLPVYLRCNDVKDCPSGEDELYCKGNDNQPGFYHCYQSKINLHLNHLCDGVAQCPRHDDEEYCGLQCPSQCHCQGLAFVCSKPIVPKDYPDLRYLDATGTGIALRDLQSNHYLVSVTLSGCGLTKLEAVRLKNLRELNLSNNSLHVLDFDILWFLPNLKVLYLSWNPINKIMVSITQIPHSSMNTIHLSGLKLHSFSSLQTLTVFPNIEIVNISYSKIEQIDSFKNLSKLTILDMSESPITTFPPDVFMGLEHLERVYSMNYKLCCPAVLPENFAQGDCIAPVDDISSCEDLLRLPAFRYFLWIFAIIAISGNSGSFIVRQFLQKKSAKAGFPVFVTNLCVADLLMGVYLAIIGVADYFYQGSYLWHDELWKQSWACRIAGFMSLLSSEVSAFIICLITLDRFIVLRFPFTQRRFQRWSARMGSGFAWFIGIVIAAVPLTPVTENWNFYGQTGICIPLPFSKFVFPEQKYSFGIMIVLNFILFLMIAFGQVAIFCSVRSNRKTISCLKGKSREIIIAHRLAFIVLTDFLCWFPIGLLGLLAVQNIQIPDEVNVGMAIFVLPLNSALNPFLYTFNAVMERRREKEMKRVIDFLERRIRSEIQEKKARHQPCTISSQPVALMTHVMEKTQQGQLSYREADLIYSMARKLVSETSQESIEQSDSK